MKHRELSDLRKANDHMAQRRARIQRLRQPRDRRRLLGLLRWGGVR